MISEGSCDTEDWSNDAENSALITGINYSLIYIQIESRYFKLNNVFDEMGYGFILHIWTRPRIKLNI